MKALFVLLLLSCIATGQQPENHQQSTPPVNARFEIVQSGLLARTTFRLDRYTGRVSQLVQTSTGDATWEQMEIQRLLLAAPTPTRAHFQIFTSGLAARHTYLIDTDSGQTWVLVTGRKKPPVGAEYEVQLWQLIPE